MYNATTEYFLGTYFLFDAIAGRLIGNSTFLFDRLYDVFLMPSEGRLEMFELTQSESVRDIKTYADYAQVCRIQKYAALAHIDALPQSAHEIVSIKGDALRKADALGFGQDEATDAALGKLISDGANMGIVAAVCALGFLQSEGLFVSQNTHNALKNFEKAAQWNSVEGILLALYYDKDGRQKNLDRLYTATRGTLYEQIYAVAHRVYGTRDARALPENKLLQKAVGAGILKSELYAPQYARFIFSGALGIKDKERALFSGQKETIAELAELPLKLAYGRPPFDAAALDALPVLRESERGMICKSADDSDLRKYAGFRPTCICSDSDYILGLYCAAVADAYSGAHVEVLDVADLNEYDFEPTKNNVFVRGLDEDEQNVCILRFSGDIRESVAAPVKSFLQSGRRSKFRLQRPAAVIDLSAVLPVCFCDRKNAPMLKPYCEVIEIAPLDADEKRRLLSYALDTKARDYGMSGAHADDEAADVLVSYSADRAVGLIDRVLRSNRGGGTVTVTAGMLKSVLNADTAAKYKYGFGGADNEVK